MEFSQNLISACDFSLHARSIRYHAGEYQCHRWADCLLYLGPIVLLFTAAGARLARCIATTIGVVTHAFRRERRRYGISENDFERFVCARVEVGTMLPGRNCSDRNAKNRRDENLVSHSPRFKKGLSAN